MLPEPQSVLEACGSELGITPTLALARVEHLLRHRPNDPGLQASSAPPATPSAAVPAWAAGGEGGVMWMTELSDMFGFALNILAAIVLSCAIGVVAMLCMARWYTARRDRPAV